MLPPAKGTFSVLCLSCHLAQRTCENNRSREKLPKTNGIANKSAVPGVHTEKCYVKDMEYCHYTSMGFLVGWYEPGL